MVGNSSGRAGRDRASKVIFINRFFHPDHSATSQMLSGIAFSLAREGRDVTVITSRLRYDAPDARLSTREEVDGVKVHRVWTSRFGRRSLAGRALDYLTFYPSAALALLRLSRQGDIVVAKTDPPMLSLMVAPLARVRGAALVNWLQDIFPEVASKLGFAQGRVGRVAHRLLRSVRNFSLRHAHMNVVLGDRMAEYVSNLGVAPWRIRTIPNWADGTSIYPVGHEQNELRKAWGGCGKFIVEYSGNLGRAHDYRTLIDAIAHLEANRDAPGAQSSARPEILWVFIGGGASYEALKHEVAARQLTSVRFEPYQPTSKLAESLSAADVHLVSLHPELEGLVVPSKAYGIAAVGRPAIFVGDPDGEISRLLSRNQFGVTVRRGDGKELAQAIEALAGDPELCSEMGRNARAAFDAAFDRQTALSRWQVLLRDVGSGSYRRAFFDRHVPVKTEPLVPQESGRS